MGLFNFNKKASEPTEPSNENIGDEMAFLAHVNVGDRDLSKPYIDERRVGAGGYVYFGQDNLYPEIYNNLYVGSGLHSACVNFKTNSIVGGGYEWTGVEKMTLDKQKAIRKLEIKLGLKKLMRTIAKDFIKHNRAYVLLRYDKDENAYIKAKSVDPSKIRKSFVGTFSFDTPVYFFSEDYSRMISTKKIDAYYPGCKSEWQLMELQGETGGSDTYPLPDYNGGLNWIFLDSEISYLYKQGIVNAINPSLIFKFPFETTPQVKNKINATLKKQGVGAKNMGKIFTFFKPKEQQPEIETVKTSNNDKLYKGTSEEIKDNISYSHQMDPVLIGVAKSGKLGNTQEIETSYTIFEKNWVMTNREIVEDFINDIIDAVGRKDKIIEDISFNRYDLFEHLTKNEEE